MSENKDPSSADNRSRKGLNPMELLSMPRAERIILTWLTRNPNGTLDQICVGVSSTAEEVAPLLTQLTAVNYLLSAESDGNTVYTVNYNARKTRRAHSLPAELWKKAGLEPNDTNSIDDG
jgi:hypothetical protein